MIGALSARKTPFHGKSAAGKLVLLCVFCTCVSVLRWPGAGWAGLCIVMAMASWPGGWFLRLVLSDLRAPALIAVLIAGVQTLAGQPMLGVSIAGSLLGCIGAAMLFSRTTSPAETLDVLDRWLATLRVGIVTRRRLSLAVAMTLRFIPALSARGDHLIEAHRARSPRRLGWRIIPPLALGALDEADQAAEALRARAHTD